MKKYLVMAMFLASVTATATAAPTAVTVPNDTPTEVSSTGAAGQYTLSGDGGQAAGGKFWGTDTAKQGQSFVKVAFTVTGGNAVLSAVLNTATQFSAAAASTKGNQVFGGNTTAGAVKLIGACTSTGCVIGDLTTTAADKGLGGASSM